MENIRHFLDNTFCVDGKNRFEIVLIWSDINKLNELYGWNDQIDLGGTTFFSKVNELM